jgi:hypothetical protein
MCKERLDTFVSSDLHLLIPYRELAVVRTSEFFGALQGNCAIKFRRRYGNAYRRR